VLIEWLVPDVQENVCCVVYVLPSTIKERPDGFVCTVTCTMGGLTVKVLVCTSLQVVLLMVIGPLTAPFGTVAVICVLLLTVNPAEILLENLTAVTPLKPLPVIVTLLPTIPLAGVIPLTLGQGLT
jgi:hypothetical protein